MNSYEAKQQAKKERYEELAQKAARESNAAGNAALDMARQIPFGQPVLVGHHSESKHRNHIKRTDAKMHKAAQLAEKAAQLAEKAAGVGTGGISSDDPDAIDKLKEKMEIMREFQAGYKEINRLIRKGVPDEEIFAGKLWKLKGAVSTSGYSWEKAKNGRGIVPRFTLTNLNARIKSTEKRINQLEALAQRETKTHNFDGFCVIENAEENRVQFTFDGIPPIEARNLLKQHGFKWSRFNKAWQRHLNNAGIYAARVVIKEFNDKSMIYETNI